MGGIQLILRTKFTKVGYLKYLSHLDFIRLFTRSFSKAGVPVKFSEGYNPHPKFSIGNPLPLGTESLSEYMDVELSEPMLPEDFMDNMNKVLPEGVEFVECRQIEKGSSLSSLISWSCYEIKFEMQNNNEKVFESSLIKWKQLSEVYITKRRKKRNRRIENQVNITPLIGDIIYKGTDEEGFLTIHALLSTGEAGNLKPIELIEAMEKEMQIGIDLDMVLIKRLEVFTDIKGEINELA